LARNYLDDKSLINGTPVISNSQLLLLSDRFRYCIGKATIDAPNSLKKNSFLSL
jgi:hypothetical protein